MAPGITLENCLPIKGSLDGFDLSAAAKTKADSLNSQFDLANIEAKLREVERADAGLTERDVKYYFKFTYDINSKIEHYSAGELPPDSLVQKQLSQESGAAGKNQALLDDTWILNGFTIAGQDFTGTYNAGSYRLPSAPAQNLVIQTIDVVDYDETTTIGEYDLVLTVSAGHDGVMNASISLNPTGGNKQLNGVTTTSRVEDRTLAQVVYFDTRAQSAVYAPENLSDADLATHADKLVARIDTADVLDEIEKTAGVTIQAIANIYNGNNLVDLTSIGATVADRFGQDNPVATHARSKSTAVTTANVFSQGEQIVLVPDDENDIIKMNPVIAMNGNGRSISLIPASERQVFAVIVQS